MITQDEVKEALKDDSETGIFIWIKSSSNRIKYGQKAGYIDSQSGYVRISIGHDLYHAHRLAFLYVNGYLPKYIDHINGCRSDNRIANLRSCSQTQNNQNSKLRNNSSGHKGVSFDKRSKKWESYINIGKKKKSLGLFNDIELADFVVREARILHYGEFCRHE